MKDIQDKLLGYLSKYSGLGSAALNNMRLLLLILFSILSGYLVFRINGLVNQELPEITLSDEQKATDISTKKPDESVLSVFNELIPQDVTLESDFENNRTNPF